MSIVCRLVSKNNNTKSEVEKIEIIEINGKKTAILNSEETILNTAQDALDLLGNCSYMGADQIIVSERNITPQFFDLKTGVAGDMLQKFSNYRMRVAFVGDFSKYRKKSIRDFIFESNKRGDVSFVASDDEARKILAR
jgi:hypothetical protein